MMAPKQGVIRIATLVSLIVAAGCGGTTGGDDDAVEVTCGTGTVLEDDTCVRKDASGELTCGEGTERREGSCVAETSEQQVDCGDGTKLVEGVCELDTDICGPGTTMEEGECVPIRDEICGPGTAFDEGEGACVSTKGVTCGEGTVRADNECVPKTDPTEACTEGLVWDAENRRCKLAEGSCGEGTELDSRTGKCVVSDRDCRRDEVLFRDECVQRQSFCSGDAEFSDELGRCVAGTVVTGDCDDPTVPDSKVRTDTVWPRGNCYRVEESLTVKNGATLAVHAGAEVRFAQDAGLELKGSNSALVALGESDNEVLFTGTEAKRGHWRGLYLHESPTETSRLEHVVVEHAGGAAWDGFAHGAGVTVGETQWANGVELTVDDLTSRNNSGHGLIVGETVPVDAIDGIANSTFAENAEQPVRVTPGVVGHLGSETTFEGNGTEEIVVTGGQLTGRVRWESYDLPYRVVGSIKVKKEDGALELAPGVRAEFAESTGLVVVNGGGLSADGSESEPIVLTGAEQSAGHWAGVWFHETSNVFNHLEHLTISYAGSQPRDGFPHGAGLTVGEKQWANGVRLEARDITLESNAGHGMVLGSTVSRDALQGLASSTFKGNERAPLRLPPAMVDLLGADTSFDANGDQWIVVVGGEVNTHATWPGFDLPYRITGSLKFKGESALFELEPGARLEFEESKGLTVVQQAGIDAAGTASNPISFTGTSETKGHWPGIWLEATSNDSNQFAHVDISYGGGSAFDYAANLTLYDDQWSGGTRVSVSLENVTLANSNGKGVYVSDDSDGQDVELRKCANLTFSDNAGDAVAGEVDHWKERCGAP